MSLASKLSALNNNSLPSSSQAAKKSPPPPPPPPPADDTESKLSTLLGAYTTARQHKSMEKGAAAYSQSGLHTPYPSALSDDRSEHSSTDHASPAQYPAAAQAQDPRSRFTTSTPTSHYGVYTPTARGSTSSIPEHIQRQYHPASTHSGSSGGMAQPTSPSSVPLQDGRSNHQSSNMKSDSEVPIDPSIAASSPTYPPHGNQYSPYPPQQDMSHGYPGQHPGGPMYTQPRPDWAGYGHPAPHGLPAGYAVSSAQTPTSAAPAGQRPGQVSDLIAYIAIYDVIYPCAFSRLGLERGCGCGCWSISQFSKPIGTDLSNFDCCVLLPILF